MEPKFALSLSFEGIALLRRAQAGWVVVGDVLLDVPDLAGALAELRDKGGAGAEEVKLVIPNGQIRYLETQDRGAKGAVLDAQIQGALDGATPYDVLELAYDHSKRGKTLLIAAVARETLEEAEAFAVAHGFTPVSHCAIAEPDAFSGEVFFGRASQWSGEEPTRAAEAIRILAAPPVEEIEPPVAPVAEAPAEPEPAPEAAPDAPETPDAPAVAAPEDDRPEPAPQPAPRAELKRETPPPVTGASAPSIQEPSQSLPAFSSIRAARTDMTTPSAAVASLSADPVSETPPRAGKPVFGKVKKADLVEDLTNESPAATPSTGMGRTLGFFSRNKAAAAPTAPVAPAAANGPKAAPQSVTTSAMARLQKIAAAKPAPKDPDQPPSESDAELERMTVFGQRDKQKIGGKPRFLGLMLTAVLLLFLAGVAAWASVFLDTGLARIFGPSEPTVEIDVAALPSPVEETEIVLDEGTIEVASLEDPLETDLIEDDAGVEGLLSQPIQPEILSPEEAEATYAATGIWQRTPDAPELPDMIGLGEIHVVTLDPAVEGSDAIAIQQPKDHTVDLAFVGLPNPVGPETLFDLDERGLVRATPKGALNPEGVMVYAGAPPVSPPLRPAEAALLVEDPELLALRVRLQAFRPKARPDNLLDGYERTLFSGRTRSELSALRPVARPVTEKEAAEADTEATAQAVQVSRRPIARPRDFASAVAKAQENAKPAEPVKVAAAATVAPKIPSSASVAKQATVKNAINLSKINLIGVYGKPSSRRALVRLSNGRYKKVQVGDSIDGGRVAAIGESELRYVKGGRNMVIKLPKS